MSSKESTVECIGSLLIPSLDVQELSQSSIPNVMASGKSNSECVGSLLVQSNSVKELSDAPKPEFPVVNLKKRVTVGTLLVAQDDLKTHDIEDPDSPTLMRRITQVMQGEPPDDAEPDHWVD